LVSVVSIIEGFILAVIFTVILIILGAGTILGEPTVLVGFLLAGIIVGYISYGDIIDGVINGALMGVAGAIIIWILSLFQGQIAAFSATLSSYVPINTPQTLIYSNSSWRCGRCYRCIIT
jgi:fucose 4-O-acetylase-like acetyltransferase